MYQRLSRLFEVSHSGHPTVVPMEGLRGLAVFLVFLVHYLGELLPYMAPIGRPWPLSAYVHLLGRTGVDLFFVLSGYLIYGSLLRRQQELKPYLYRRVERIYPTFLAVLAIYLLVSWAMPAQSKLPGGFVAATLYILQNVLLLPGLFPIAPIITVAWSLSYECFFYLVTPVLIGALRLRSWRPRARIGLFLFAAVLILARPEWTFGHPRLSMFLSGMILFEVLALMSRQSRAWLDALGLCGLAGGLALFIYLWLENFPVGLRLGALFVGFFAVCLAAFGQDGLTKRIFSWTPLRWLGNISYSYYLIHALVLRGVFYIFALFHRPVGVEPELFWILITPAFALTFVVSALLFVLVERPISLD